MTKTILMIHGFGAAGEIWALVAARFKAAGYAVETPTLQAALRTVGPPPPGLAGKTLSDYVAEMSDLAQALARRDGAAPIVFGHSMGGLIAQKLAEAGLAAGLVLFAPASPADARGPRKMSPVFTFLNIALTAKPETKAVKIWKTGFKWGVLNQTPPARHETIFAATVHDSGRALSDLAYPDRDPNKTVHVDAGKVTAPVLVLAGARDRTTPVEDLRRVGRKYAGADYREYPANAHWLIDEPGSDEILAEVETWLDAKGLGARTPAAVAPAAPIEAAAKAAAKPKTAATKSAPPAAKAPVRTKAPAKAKAAAEPAVAVPSAVATPASAKPAAKSKAASVKAAPSTAELPPKTPPKTKTPKAKPQTGAAADSAAPTPKAAAPAPVATTQAKATAKPKAAPQPVAKAPAVAPKKAAKSKIAPAEPKPAAKALAAAKKAPATAKVATKAPAAKLSGKSSPRPKKTV
ncbi:alpha/beta hydrolase [Caulobacter sp. LARHSG274]